MPPKKDKKDKKGKDKGGKDKAGKDQKDEGKPVEKSEKETRLEAELKKVEDEYTAAREKVNELRVQKHALKEKSSEIQEEQKEYSQFFDKMRENRQNRIISVNDEQQATLKSLEDDDTQAEAEHNARMDHIEEEIRLALFKRAGLKDQILRENLSEVIALKERNDKRIEELREEFSRRQIEDSEMLQNMKAECLHAQKQFKMQSQLAAKEAKTQLKIDAHRIINERTTAARKTNRFLRDKVIKHIDETKVLAIQRKVLEAQQRDLKAEIQCLQSFRKK